MEALPKGVNMIFENKTPYLNAYTFLLKFPFNTVFFRELKELVEIGFEYPVTFGNYKWVRLWTEDFDKVVALVRRTFR